MKKVLLCGSCDVTAICRYIKRKDNIKILDYNSTGSWMNSMSKYWLQSIENIKVPDYQKYGIYYPDSSLFNTNDNDVLIISILGELGYGLYKNKQNGGYLFFGYANEDATKKADFYLADEEVLNKEIIKPISEEFEFIGENKIDDIVTSYKMIISHINPQTKIYILLGPTFSSSFGEKNHYFKTVNGVEKYQELNSKMIREFSKHNNVIFIDPMTFYKKPKKQSQLYFYGYPSIRHYPRRTYFKIAKFLSRQHINIKLSFKEALRYHIKELFK